METLSEAASADGGVRFASEVYSSPVPRCCWALALAGIRQGTRHAARDCFLDADPVPVHPLGPASTSGLQAVALVLRQTAGESGTQGKATGQEVAAAPCVCGL